MAKVVNRKTPLGGKRVSRRQAFKGLGNQKRWELEATETYNQFREKPPRKLK